MKIIFILSITFCSLLAYSQSGGTTTPNKYLEQQEAQLTALYTRLIMSADSNTADAETYSHQFSKQLRNLITNNPATLNFPFKLLTGKNDVRIKTSKDGRLRLYSWDNRLGGSMRYYETIYQWKDSHRTYTTTSIEKDSNSISYVCEIYTVQTDTVRYYLVVTETAASNKDMMQSVTAYAIQQGKLKSAKLFRTKNASFEHIDVPYNFFSVVDRPERPVKLIWYDTQQKALYLPVVDQQGQIINRNLRYQLRNGLLKFIGTVTAQSTN